MPKKITMTTLIKSKKKNLKKKKASATTCLCFRIFPDLNKLTFNKASPILFPLPICYICWKETKDTSCARLMKKQLGPCTLQMNRWRNNGQPKWKIQTRTRICILFRKFRWCWWFCNVVLQCEDSVVECIWMCLV